LSNRSEKLIENLCNAFESGIQAVESYARVQPGDKSLLDVLIPTVDYIKSKCNEENFTINDWKELAIVAEQAAQETKSFIPKVGRAAYTKSVDAITADPGACAVAIIFQAVCDVFAKTSTH
jgi:dihydroxyacetone kinase